MALFGEILDQARSACGALEQEHEGKGKEVDPGNCEDTWSASAPTPSIPSNLTTITVSCEEARAATLEGGKGVGRAAEDEDRGA